MNHPPTYVRTFSLHKVRENCHFLDHPPTPMSLRNIKMAPKEFFRTCNVLPLNCTHLALWRGKDKVKDPRYMQNKKDSRISLVGFSIFNKKNSQKIHLKVIFSMIILWSSKLDRIGVLLSYK